MKNNIKKKNTNKFSKKRAIIIISLMIILVIIVLIIFKNILITTKVIEEPPIPNNCSNESIKEVWEFIFKGNSENLTIVYPSKTFLDELKNKSVTPIIFKEIEFGKEAPIIEGCPIYAVYQINGSDVKLIQGINREMMFGTYGNLIMAVNVKYSPYMISKLKNTNYNSLDQNFTFEEMPENETWIYEREVNITTLEQAKLHFESIFNVNSSNWINDSEYYYNFYENETSGNITLFGESINLNAEIINTGYVLGELSLDGYMYTEYSLFGMIKNLQEKYKNWTSPINTSLKDITIQINNSKLELLKNYKDVQRVIIAQNNQTIIETEINFSKEIDLTKIILKKQEATSDKGYVIINGLNYTKNITLDKVSNRSESVCIKNKQINSIDEISEKCEALDEYIVNCSGNLSNNVGNFTCKVYDNKFVVTGLKHSAILEIVPPEPPCIQNWQCEEWTEYPRECGYRNCTDLNNCGNITGKPIEEIQCPIICIPDWKCTQFIPEKCPKEERRTRTCTDISTCGTDEGKPSLTQNCERKNNLIWIILGIVLGIGLILTIILTTIKKDKGQPPYSTQNFPPKKQFPPSQYSQQIQQKTPYSNQPSNQNNPDYYYPKEY